MDQTRICRQNPDLQADSLPSEESGKTKSTIFQFKHTHTHTHTHTKDRVKDRDMVRVREWCFEMF